MFSKTIEYKDDVKNSILKVASQIFTRFGFNKTTMDEIAKASKKGKSTLYYYFSSKEEIYKAVVDKEANAIKSRLISVISEDITSQEKLKKYILIRMISFKEMINFYDVMRSDYFNNIEYIEEFRQKYDNEEITLVKMILLESVSKDVFEIEDVDIASETLCLILKGLEYPLSFRNSTDAKIEENLDKVLKIIFKGIVKK